MTERSDAERELLRLTFDEDAELYDAARPGYPTQLVDDLVELAALGRGDSVLELGCGTGKLSTALAERGLRLVGVELGRSMAAVAGRRLAPYADARVDVAAFEDWPLPQEPFDLVVAATSFHWIDPELRVSKSVAALRPGGSLAVVSTEHVRGGDDFFEAVQECYVRWDPDVTEPAALPTPEEVPEGDEELDGSPLLGPVTLRRYVWDQTYSTAQYLDLLLTYSGHRALPAGPRRGLLGCIAELIESSYDGRVTKTYLSELRVATRT